MSLVCPSCGNDQFTVVLTARISYTYTFDAIHGTPIEQDSSVEDGGDIGDVDLVSCDDCFASLDMSELITSDDYNSED